MQGDFERTSAFFSSIQWAVYCWNTEETLKREKDIPKKAHWVKVLVNTIPTHECSIVTALAKLQFSGLELVTMSRERAGWHDLMVRPYVVASLEPFLH